MFAAIWFALLASSWLVLSRGVAHAYPVPELPADNLIVNPWFRDGNQAGFDGWARPLNEGLTWGPSQKESNPSPDMVVSGTCGNQQVYCGTAARWAEQEKVYYPNVDVFAYQVVAADPSERKLTFFTYFVSHRVDVGAVNIYGGNSPDGPWEHVWTPLYHTQSENIVPESGEIRDLWLETGFLERTLEQGFLYYKVELQSRLPELPHDMIRGGGFKITGIYFSVAFTDESADSPTPFASPAAPVPDTGESDLEPTVPAAVESPAATSTTDATSGATIGAITETPAAPRATEVTEAADPQTNDQALPALSAEATSATDVTLILSPNRSRRVRVERSLDGITGWRPLATLGPDVTEYVDSGLSPNTTHYYRLRASQEDVSAVVSVQTPPLFEPTLEPTSVSVAPTVAPAQVEVPPQPEVETAAEEISGQDTSPQSPGTSTELALPGQTYLLAVAATFIIGILAGIGLLMIWGRRRSHQNR